MVTDVVGEEELYEKKLKLNERNVVIDSSKPATSRFTVKQLDYSLANSMGDACSSQRELVKENLRDQ